MQLKRLPRQGNMMGKPTIQPGASRAENARAVARAATEGRRVAVQETRGATKVVRESLGTKTPSVQNIPAPGEGRHRAGD